MDFKCRFGRYTLALAEANSENNLFNNLFRDTVTGDLNATFVAIFFATFQQRNMTTTKMGTHFCDMLLTYSH